MSEIVNKKESYKGKFEDASNIINNLLGNDFGFPFKELECPYCEKVSDCDLIDEKYLCPICLRLFGVEE